MPAKIGKTVLAERVAACTGLSKAAAHDAVSALLEAGAAALADGDTLYLHEIGTLQPVQRPGRSGTAPNGERWRTGAEIGVRFRATQALKARLNPL